MCSDNSTAGTDILSANYISVIIMLLIVLIHVLIRVTTDVDVVVIMQFA